MPHSCVLSNFPCALKCRKAYQSVLQRDKFYRLCRASENWIRVDCLQHFPYTDYSSPFLSYVRDEAYRLNHSRQIPHCDNRLTNKSFSSAQTQKAHLYQFHESTADKKKLCSFCHFSAAVQRGYALFLLAVML